MRNLLHRTLLRELPAQLLPLIPEMRAAAALDQINIHKTIIHQTRRQINIARPAVPMDRIKRLA